jgi:hypothetical protein
MRFALSATEWQWNLISAIKQDILYVGVHVLVPRAMSCPAFRAIGYLLPESGHTNRTLARRRLGFIGVWEGCY